MLIFYKSVDYSVLYAGLTVPVVYKEMLFTNTGISLQRGERQKINIVIDGETYIADMVNILFDEIKYPNHKDLLQIRYGKHSPLAQKIRNTFCYTESRIAAEQMKSGKKRIKDISEHEKEFLAIYSTSIQGTIMFDCIVNSEFLEETKELSALGEIAAERILDGTDPNADVLLKTRICKIRKLTKTILTDLKIAYGYRCQICGEYIGEKYGSNLIHAHHIDYFTKSANNNSNNIMVVCPNHHSIIHDKNPIFDHKTKTYLYPNGYREGLKVNIHL